MSVSSFHLFVFLLFGAFTVSASQTIDELLKKCNGLSFTEPFYAERGIGQFYQLGAFANETVIGENFTCPHELWEIARNGTIYVNRERTTIEEGDLQILTAVVVEPIPTEPRFSSNYLWRREGVDSPVFGRLSYSLQIWDGRRYLFAHACRMTGLYTFYLLSREPDPIPPAHMKRLQDEFHFQYSHEFEFKNCASTRPAVCYENPPGSFYGLEIFYNPF